MKSNLYNFFFPENKKVRFRKTKWTIMIIMQELMMCKFKAIFKIFYNKTYRKDIFTLRDILSKGKLKGRKGKMNLWDINFSHEINYPEWVDKLERDFRLGVRPKRIKVFYHKGRYIVVDGNHRLCGMRRAYSPHWQYMDKQVDVLFLEYK